MNTGEIGSPLPFLKFVYKIGCYRSKWLLSSALLGMKSEGTSCETFIMFNVSFIRTYMKRDSRQKLQAGL